MGVIDVRITFSNGQFTPSQDPVTLHKTNGETIKWQNDTSESLTITFTDGSPFPADRNPYQVAAGKQVNSGNITAQEGTEWAYSITAPSGAMTDPQVIIER